MIITRSPLRISLGGGGTDLPSYYEKHGGFLIAAAINKYVYFTLHRTFMADTIIKYSKLEHVRRIEDIEHPILRETLAFLNYDIKNLELSSLADIPAGTGLGSSGAFTTALIAALYAYKRKNIQAAELAEIACHIEMERLNEPIGKQDQYIAAFGGLTCFEFSIDGKVSVTPLQIDKETLYNLEDNLLLFFTGYSRSASSILQEQDGLSKIENQKMIDNLHFTKELGQKSKEALESGNLREFSHLMNVHWEYKKQRSSRMSNPQIDHWYRLALKNGALGGKMIGAGGGGFLMFYTEDKTRLRHTLSAEGLEEVRFFFDFYGTRIEIQ